MEEEILEKQPVGSPTGQEEVLETRPDNSPTEQEEEVTYKELSPLRLVLRRFFRSKLS